MAKWLSIHRAEPLLVDRKTGPMKTIFIKRAAVSVTGSIPPHTLSRALGTQHIENGLAARLLLALPPRHGKRWTEATVDPQLTRRVEVLFGRLLALDFGTDANDTLAPIDLPLTADGKAAWVQFYDEHAREQETVTGPLAAAYSKIEGYAARLALVVHLVRWAADDPTLGNPDAIDGHSIGVGATLARWFAHEARRVYAVLGETDEERDRRELAELLRGKAGSVTSRDLMRSSRQYRTADEAEGALDGLVKAGYGDWREDDHGGGRGRPTRRFVLADAADVDTNSAKPEENRICVNVSAVNGAGDADPVDDLLAEAAEEDSDEWGVV